MCSKSSGRAPKPFFRSTRRGFLTGCSAAIASLAGARFGQVAFAGTPGANDEILVVVFLRGGMDGLNFVMPLGGGDRAAYEAARPDIRVPTSGSNAARVLQGNFGIHGSAGALQDLFQDGKLAVIHAAGLSEANRSHFDAMKFMELGTPGEGKTKTGWLHRHMSSATNLPSDIVMPSLSVGSLQATSLLGSSESLNMSSVGDFSLNVGPYQWRPAVRTAMRNILQRGDSWLHQTGVQALDALDIVELSAGGNYTPANGAVYPGGSLGDHLELVAQMVKLDLGLRVATIDFGGWDTHNGQGDSGGGFFADRVRTLADSLAAFYLDLDGQGAQSYTSRLTVVVMSEFGRRLRQNADRGTDHGHGNVMMVLSGNAIGGIHGQWPGLANGQLFDGADLQVTTDYRRVLSEVLIRRMGNPNLGEIFPDYSGYSPMGIVQGTDLTPVLGASIFSDGFDSGNTGRWSSVV
ncbi:MAG: DUF1501 domain-containing protein [Acidobacteriota bacterium]